MSEPQSPPFGTYAPAPLQAWFRARAHRLQPGWTGRRLGLLLNRLAGGKRGPAFDVEIFDGQRARLHTIGNVCEKRVYCTPQFWDPRERASLAEAIHESEGRTFTFLDVGANVGLYSLFALGVARGAGKPIRIVCVEPAPVAAGRLTYNIALNRGEGEITHFACAATRVPGTVKLFAHADNLGGHSLGGKGEHVDVEGRPLSEIVDEAGFDRVDAMKMDIEGAEKPALDGLFEGLDRGRWPRLVILENAPLGAEAAALGTCLDAGYRLDYTTKLNSVLRLEP